MLWLIFAALCLVILAILLVPLLRASSALRRRADYDIVVYRSQLGEIDQEIEEGLLTPEQADAARAEVHRRMLAAEDAEMERPIGFLPGAGRFTRIGAAIVMALVIPLGAGAMYASLGSPNLPGKPYLWRVHNDPEFASGVTADAMAAMVQANPSADGFAQLGRTYFAARQYEPAVAAYRRAFAMGTSDPMSYSEFGESVVMLNNGAVVPEAMTAFLKALAGEPKSERSRFYLGLAEVQIGNFRQAVAIWRDLEKSSAPDAPWLPMVREHIKVFAQQGGFDPNSVPPSPPDVKAMGAAMHAMGSAPPPAPTPSTGATMAGSTGPVHDPAILAMVQRLADKMAKNPSDVAGWQRLAHAYVVLGEGPKAVVAAQRAAALKPADTGVLLGLAEAQQAAAPSGDEAPVDAVATMRRVLALDAKNGQALYFVGVAEAKSGNVAKAKAMWTEALKTVPPDDPLAIDIHHRLAGVKVK